MSFLDDVWDKVSSNPVKTAATGFGGMAGLPAGIFGVGAGGYLGSKIGGFISPDGKQGGADYGGMMPYPTYIGMDPEATQIGMGPEMAKYARESMRNEPSPGTQLALTENAKGANMGRAQAMKAAEGLADTAESNLAMKGGIGAGARERIGKYTSDIGMSGMNAVDANAGANRANLMISDEAARVANLDNAGKTRMGLDALNMKNKQGEFDRRNAYNLNLYDNQMAAWGAGKTADAMQNSGKQGLFKS